MKTISTPDSMSKTTVAPVANSDCCGGKTGGEFRDENSKVIEHDARKHATLGNATGSCCCGGTQTVKS